MNKKGILYGVGVGPGDPELLTLKALRLLREADVVAVPDRGSGEMTAYGIVKEHIADKPILRCPTPMTRDAAALEVAYNGISLRLRALLDDGKNVVFITLGDPTVYSTYVYVHERVVAMGYEARLVPGVTSFCAAAARIGVPLCERSERLLIVPASYGVRDALEADANKVFMKAGSGIAELRDALRDAGKLEYAHAVENCGMPGERVFENLEGLEDSGYYSIIIVKDAGVGS